MKRLFVFFGALLLVMPRLAFATPSATLSVHVVPAVATGCLSGSICPPGTWVNDLDEHFTGTSLDSIWMAGTNNYSVAAGVSNCQVSGALVFNNPGITLYGLPYDTTNNAVNGCAVQQPVDQGYSTPGYFEMRIKLDTASNSWNGGFFEFGPNAGCGGTVAQNGTELDLVETSVSSYYLHWDGYTTCDQQASTGNWGSVDGQFHVWGVDYGDNNVITFYSDGVQGGQFTFSDGVNIGHCTSGILRCGANGNWLGEFIFFDFLCFYWVGNCGATVSNGLSIDWVRHYHH
jgi:hypothetical protein